MAFLPSLDGFGEMGVIIQEEEAENARRQIACL